jgi:hypothetical protein
LGLVDPESGKVDAMEIQLYMYQSLLALVEMTDLEEYTVFAPVLIATTANQATYPLPADFGRLIQPRVLRKRGLTLVDGLDVIDLDYEEPNALTRLALVPPRRPERFTITRRQLTLHPTPDANAAVPYIIRGLYIAQVERPVLDDEVVLQHPAALIEETLWRLAGDMGKLPQDGALTATRTEALTRLVGGAANTIERPRAMRPAATGG